MIRLVALLVVVAACQTREAANEPPAPVAPVAPVQAIQPAPDAVVADPTTIQNDMRTHFAAVIELEKAIVRGRLEEAREHARAILAHEEPPIEGGAPFTADMKRSAEALIAAPDLPTAGSIAAVLGRTCSRCHEATNAVIAFAWEEQPELDGSLRAQMQRHQWAAARLWEGIVGPSDEMWAQGTEALVTAELDALAAARGIARGDVQALAEHVRSVATRARATTDHGARARLYGDLLSTCAGCHQLVRPAPVSGP